MTFTSRTLDTFTLDGAAKFYATEFQKNSIPHSVLPSAWVGGRSWVVNNLINADFKDEHEYLVRRMDEFMSEDFLAEWERVKILDFHPRHDDMLEQLLAEKLAIFPDGAHIPGKIGTVQVGQRVVGRSPHITTIYEPRGILEWAGLRSPRIRFQHTRMRNDYWAVYAGEQQERMAESAVVDDLPEDARPFTGTPGEVLATNPKMANVSAVLACDAIVDNLDIGTTAANIRGLSGAQPADPDTAETGTLLFELVMSDPAFGGAVDDTGKATATASAITDDSSANATGTLGYCRCVATGTGADDLMDGEAGTTGSDFNFNTLSIVSGSTVSMTAFTVSVSE